MSNRELPDRPSLEYLKKLAKDRLEELRRSDPRAQLAAALLAVARDHGFPSWRALKAEVDERQKAHREIRELGEKNHREIGEIRQFFEACTTGDIGRLQNLIATDPTLIRASSPDAHYQGWTGLHAAAKAGQAAAARWLLAHGADVNAREAGDNTYPLHWAAAHGHLETVRALLDAGGDVHGSGDVHELDVIGWATFYHGPGDEPSRMSESRREVVALLVERGAKHHIFSAMSVGDLDLIQQVVEENPETLDRRMSRFEGGLTPLHFTINRKRYDILDLLIELGADLEAKDMSGRTALETAMLRGDREAMTRLHAAGAKAPQTVASSTVASGMAKLASSVKKGVPMIYVPDVARALAWYTSIGFKELERFEDDGVVNFGMVSFGGAEIMINMHGKAGRQTVSLWFYTDQVDQLYQLLKSRQMKAAETAIAGQPGTVEGIEFEQDIEDMFYGARQFAIRDLNGYQLYFIQGTGR